MNRRARRARAAAGGRRADPEAALAEAGRRAAVGDVPGALRLLDRLLAAAPDDARARHLRGVLRLGRGDAPGAVLDLRRCRDLRPDDPETLSNLGVAEHAAGEAAAARATLERLVARVPGFAPARLNLASALRAAGEDAAALDHLRRAVALDPAYAKAWLELGRVARALGDLDTARTALERAAALPEAAEEAGAVALDAGDFAAAERHFRARIARGSAPASVHLGLGAALQELGRGEDALVACRAALAREPDLYPEALARLTSAGRGRLRLRRDAARRALLG